ncbi:hypothetical protein [Zhaonella formicivorans]|uniref:hypothetical protein n=1 Tax=Zhaonella formicivorans TaxID=2528593 RepID=UPI0010DD88FA|nr:hypothetical protein [Zhaonella formicivorans]
MKDKEIKLPAYRLVVFLTEESDQFRVLPPYPSWGRVHIDVQATEAVCVIQVDNLRQLNAVRLPPYHYYEAWLVNSREQVWTSLGAFNVLGNGQGSHIAWFNPVKIGKTTLQFYYEVVITAEMKSGKVSPGQILLRGQIPSRLVFKL